MRKKKKKNPEASWPIKTKRSSTGRQPKQHKRRTSATKSQKSFLYKGRNVALRKGEVFKKGSKSKETKTNPIAKTPANLLGMLRKIA